MDEISASSAAKKRITHLIAERPKSLLKFLQEDMNLSPSRGKELILFGAVFVNKKRTKDCDFALESGDYVRVHTEPKRYPIEKCEHVNLILFEDEDLLICNKPSGVPVHAMLDNDSENLTTYLSERLGHPVFPCHRIDNSTQGVVVFAKNKSLEKSLKKIWAGSQVKKYYLVTTLDRPPLGRMTHYLTLQTKPPHKFNNEQSENSKICELEVKEVYDGTDGSYFSLVQLLTGRTHQIRGQMAAAGFPIVGDETYGTTESRNFATTLGLVSQRIDVDLRSVNGQSYSVELPFPLA